MTDITNTPNIPDPAGPGPLNAQPGDVYPDAASLARAAADLFVEFARAAIAQRGVFTVALAGGSTPKAMYTLLAADPARVDWSRVEIYFGDERCVPPNDPDSNFRTANQALLSRIQIPERGIHRMRGELGPRAAADDYEALLRRRFTADTFDLVLLGLGGDAHTLSLFPGHNFAADADRWCTTAVAPAASPVRDRVSLTLDAVARARNAMFLIAGPDKATALARVRAAAPAGQPDVPASLIRCRSEVRWLTDKAAETRPASRTAASQR